VRETLSPGDPARFRPTTNPSANFSLVNLRLSMWRATTLRFSASKIRFWTERNGHERDKPEERETGLLAAQLPTGRVPSGSDRRDRKRFGSHRYVSEIRRNSFGNCLERFFVIFQVSEMNALPLWTVWTPVRSSASFNV